MVSSRRNRFCSCKGEVLVLAQTIKAAQEKTCFEILFFSPVKWCNPYSSVKARLYAEVQKEVLIIWNENPLTA